MKNKATKKRSALDEKTRKKRILIIIVSLICLIVSTICLSYTESKICHKNNEQELLEQATIIAEQIPALLENDYYAQLAAAEMKDCRMKAVSMALEDTPDVNHAKGLLTEIANTDDILTLTVYNLNGKKLFRAGEEPEEEYSEEEIVLCGNLLGDDGIDLIAQSVDSYGSIAFTSRILKSTAENYTWFGKNDRYIIQIDYRISPTEMEVLNYFSWINVLQNIPVGYSGFVMAVDESDGTVLSGEIKEDLFNNRQVLRGKNVNDIRIQIEEEENYADLERLKNAFSKPGKIVNLTIEDSSFQAVRVNVDGVLMIAMISEAELFSQIRSELDTRVFLLIIVCSICMLYIYFHIKDSKGTRVKGRFSWDSEFSEKLRAITILSVVSVILLGFFLEALSFTARVYRYSSTKADGVAQLHNSNMAIMNELKAWLSEDYMARCRLAGMIFTFEGEDKLTDEYLVKLAECLDVQYAYIYDETGKLMATNSEFKTGNLDKESPFNVLLEGRREYVEELSYDSKTGKNLQKAGVTLLNNENRCTGMLLIESDADEVDKITDNLGFKSIFDQISLTAGTYVFAVNSTDMSVEFAGLREINKYSPLSFADMGVHVSEFGIDEKKLQDNYLGSLKALGTVYCSAIRVSGDYYFIIMINPVQFAVNPKNILAIVIEMVSVFVFMSALTFISCIGKKDEALEKEVAEDNKEEKEDDSGSEEEKAEEGTRQEAVLAALARFAVKQKPYFDDRWAKDSVKWRDRSQSEKFSISMIFVISYALISIGLQVLIFGETSAWYYCFNGEWGRGINLRSVTVCILAILALTLIKLAVHKLLYFIAKAADEKGETICHLLDSYSGYILFIVGVIVALMCFGVNVKTLSLTGGVAGVVFGIGCQNIVADMLAGILMCFEGVVHAGDFVMFNGYPGIVLSIGVRTTRLKWFGEITVVRNNEFKNYVDYPSEKRNRTIATITVDLHESLERVEAVLRKELPGINKNLCELSGDEVSGPIYRGITDINENGMVLSFSIFCKSPYSRWIYRNLNRELKMMCERNNITLAMHQVVVNEPMDGKLIEAGNFKEEDETEEE